MEIKVKRLTTNLIGQYLKFFDDIAFCDNPEWSQCYCCYNYLTDDKEVNTRELCQQLIKEEKLNGFLAFIDDVPVGWCNCDVITNYPRIMMSPNAKDLTDDTVAVVCFTIDPNKRRKGIATKLLEEAIRYYKSKDYKWMEASSMKGASTDAENYIGPKSLYDKLAFKTVRENERFVVLRKEL
jgi:ribosomal protein S18 acetylase RimI-like enzyme